MPISVYKGTFGEYPNNCERDLYQRLGSIDVPEALTIGTSLLDTRTGTRIQGSLCVQSPAELLHGLSTYESYELVTGSEESIASFWNAVRDDDPKLISLLRETGLRRSDLTKTVHCKVVCRGDGEVGASSAVCGRRVWRRRGP